MEKLCFNHPGQVNFQAGQECCTRSHWALLWGDASPELLTFQTMMYHFFLPFLFILAGQGLTTDSLSPKASHQPAQEHSWLGIKTSILCTVQIRKMKKNSLLQTMTFGGLEGGPRCMHAVCRDPSPLAPLWQRELCPWALNKPRTLVNSIRMLGNESHPVLVLKSKFCDSSLVKFLPFG